MPEFRDEDANRLSELWNKHQKTLGATAVIVWIVGVVGLAGIGSAVWQYLRIADLGAMVEGAKEDLAAQSRAIREASGAVLTPPGTVCAWPGLLPEDQTWRSYWRPCDGSTVEFSESLWAALRGLYGNPDAERVRLIKLPDFAGQFLRGAGGNAAQVGEQQSATTALPKKAFKTGGDRDGEHHHAFTGFGHDTSKGDGGGVSFNGHFQFGDQNASRFLGPGGHSHVVAEGGDDETRPMNYAVNWVIRIQ